MDNQPCYLVNRALYESQWSASCWELVPDEMLSYDFCTEPWLYDDNCGWLRYSVFERSSIQME